jgi:hypothetical protein
MSTEATKNWREATLDASDDEGSSSSDGSTSYESEELTLRPVKRPCGEQENDWNFDPKGEARGSHAEPRVPPEDDTEDSRCEVHRWSSAC